MNRSEPVPSAWLVESNALGKQVQMHMSLWLQAKGLEKEEGSLRDGLDAVDSRISWSRVKF